MKILCSRGLLRDVQDARKQLMGIMDRHKLDVVSCGEEHPSESRKPSVQVSGTQRRRTRRKATDLSWTPRWCLSTSSALTTDNQSGSSPRGRANYERVYEGVYNDWSKVVGRVCSGFQGSLTRRSCPSSSRPSRGRAPQQVRGTQRLEEDSRTRNEEIKQVEFVLFLGCSFLFPSLFVFVSYQIDTCYAALFDIDLNVKNNKKYSYCLKFINVFFCSDYFHDIIPL